MFAGLLPNAEDATRWPVAKSARPLAGLQTDELTVAAEVETRPDLLVLGFATVDDPRGASASHVPVVAKGVESACEQRGIVSPGERPRVSV